MAGRNAILKNLMAQALSLQITVGVVADCAGNSARVLHSSLLQEGCACCLGMGQDAHQIAVILKRVREGSETQREIMSVVCCQQACQRSCGQRDHCGTCSDVDRLRWPAPMLAILIPTACAKSDLPESRRTTRRLLAWSNREETTG